MDERDRAIKQRLRDDFVHYASKCLKIRTKSGKVEPFLLNKAQLHIHQQLEFQRGQTGKVRALILKGRQQGVSTLIGARYYHRVTHSFGCQAFILTHALDATQNLYKMAQRFYENTPAPVKAQVTTSNAKELIFGLLDSGYKLGTAENKSVGRSATIQLLHGSEVGFWNNAAEHAKGIMQAVPNAPHTEIILESTANGVGNFFHQQWQLAEAGLSEYVAIFVPWFWQDEYAVTVSDDFTTTQEEDELKELYGLSNGQIAWRRNKIQEFSVNGMDGVKAFHQEYPCIADEAFTLTGEDNYIDSQLIMSARKTEAEKYGKLLVGVDPARFGDDRTSIIRRQGRVAFGLESYAKKDTMEVVGIVHNIINAEKPFKVLIDVGGLGAGIVDRLNELGHRDIIVAVNAGSKPLDSRKYLNKRAEMWGLCKEWLLDLPCQIPDNDSLHSDLSGVKYSFNSNAQLQIERKEDMKKRGIRSPDEGDALCFVENTLIRTAGGLVNIQDIKIDDEVITPLGVTKVKKLWVSETNNITTATFSNGAVLEGKGEHKIFNWNNGICRMDELQLTFDIEIYSKLRSIKWIVLRLLLTEASHSEFKQMVGIINQTIGMRRCAFFIAGFGLTLMEKYRKVMLSITKIKTGVTMTFQTWKLCFPVSTQNTICENSTKKKKTKSKTKNILKRLTTLLSRGMHLQKELNGIAYMDLKRGKKENLTYANAKFVKKNLKDIFQPNFVLNHADKRVVTKSKKLFLKYAHGAIKNFLLTNIGKWRVVPSSVQTESVPMTKVYNLTLEKHNVYYANDILVYNCLTFALPFSALQDDSKTSKTQVLSSLGTNMRKLDKLRTTRDGIR